MRTYEVMFIAHPDLDDSALQALVDRAKSWVTAAGGEVTQVDVWGRRRLAYVIKKQKEGQYILMQTTMAAPATVELSLSGDTLAVRGTAPLPWVAASASLGPPPGATHLDLSGVGALLPDELAGLERRIEGNRILFPVGSAVLGGGAGDSLRALAETFRGLAAGVAGMGYRVNLELIGRADTTGTEAANQTLSRMRVDAVRARLVSLGIPAEGLNATGIGTSQPLPAPDEAERARINRSVSFIVHLQPAARQTNGTR